MTKADLAAAAGLADYRSITAYESGETVPGEETVRALSRALRFPPAFFYGKDLPTATEDSGSFRTLKSRTAAERDAALASTGLAMHFAAWIDERFNLPAPDVPSLKRFEPEAAAAALRAHWGLGERPIKNVVYLLEARGVRIFALPQECARVDAFSVWHGNVPYVFLNTMKSGERSRFDAAHELGHLALHRHGPPRGRSAELEADRFASGFLMPRGSVLACPIRSPDVNLLIRAKRNWKVSVAALAHRLRDLGLVSEWQYRMLCIEIGQRGYRINEPEGIARELSQVLQKVLTSLRDEGVTRITIARDLTIEPDDLDALTLGLVIGAVPAGQRDTLVTPPRHPPLHRVQ